MASSTADRIGLDAAKVVRLRPAEALDSHVLEPISLPLAKSLERRRLRSYMLSILLDWAVIYVSFAVASRGYFGVWFHPNALRLAHLTIPLYLTVALATQVYSVRSLTSVRFAQWRALSALSGALALALAIAFMFKASDQVSRIAATFSLLIAAFGLVLVREMAEPLMRRIFGETAINVLVIDAGGDAIDVPHAFHLDAAAHRLDPDLNDPHMLDRIGLYMSNMDRVVVSCLPERRMEWALVFKGANVQGEIVDRQVELLGVLGAHRGEGFGSLVVSTGPLGLRHRFAKRALDLAVAVGAVVALSPLLVAVALLIKLEDRGPVLFVQRRTGRNNRFFRIYKFRSMRTDCADRHGDRSASRDDERVTRIGRLIRRTSIDELPQLFNVVRGQMSLVGPRPHALGSLAGEKQFWEVDRRYLLRHSLKPGLTGLAQIRGFRGATETELDLERRLQADLEYLDGWTVWRDLRILVKTVGVLVHDRAF